MYMPLGRSTLCNSSSHTLSLSHTNTHIYTHTHDIYNMHIDRRLYLKIPLGHRTLRNSLSLTHTYTHTHTLTYTHVYTHMIFTTDTSTDGSTFKYNSDAVPFASLSLSFSLSLSLSHTHTLSLSHTHKHIYTRTYKHGIYNRHIDRRFDLKIPLGRSTLRNSRGHVGHIEA